MIVRIVKIQGKHPKARWVVVYEGDCFDIRRLLTEQIARRKSQGAADTEDLFARPDGNYPCFRDVMRTVLTELTDPMTGQERVAYRSANYFATKLGELGLSVAQIAEWLSQART